MDIQSKEYKRFKKVILKEHILEELLDKQKGIQISKKDVKELPIDTLISINEKVLLLELRKRGYKF
jgi:hypothetical protein